MIRIVHVHNHCSAHSAIVIAYVQPQPEFIKYQFITFPFNGCRLNCFQVWAQVYYLRVTFLILVS
jgi:hypothetical protein